MKYKLLILSILIASIFSYMQKGYIPGAFKSDLFIKKFSSEQKTLASDDISDTFYWGHSKFSENYSGPKEFLSYNIGIFNTLISNKFTLLTYLDLPPPSR